MPRKIYIENLWTLLEGKAEWRRVAPDITKTVIDISQLSYGKKKIQVTRVQFNLQEREQVVFKTVKR